MHNLIRRRLILAAFIVLLCSAPALTQTGVGPAKVGRRVSVHLEGKEPVRGTLLRADAESVEVVVDGDLKTIPVGEVTAILFTGDKAESSAPAQGVPPVAGRESYPAAATPAGPVLGNRGSGIYHWPGCPNYGDISAENRVAFASREEAERAGYRAALNCKDSSAEATAPQAEASTSSGGTVNVRGYYRKDGTYVRPHTRRAPRRKN